MGKTTEGPDRLAMVERRLKRALLTKILIERAGPVLIGQILTVLKRKVQKDPAPTGHAPIIAPVEGDPRDLTRLGVGAKSAGGTPKNITGKLVQHQNQRQAAGWVVNEMIIGATAGALMGIAKTADEFGIKFGCGAEPNVAPLHVPGKIRVTKPKCQNVCAQGVHMRQSTLRNIAEP